MKKIILIIILSILLALSAYLSFSDSNKNINLDKVENIDQVLIENDTSKIIIEKQADEWIVNKSYKANNQIISQLFRLFSNIEIAMLPTLDSIDIIKENLAKRANTITFFESGNIVAKYKVGNYSPQKKSTLLMKNKQNPVYAKALGLSSDISQYVITNDLLWRNKQIFGFNVQNITSLNFINHKHLESSFSILVNDDNKYKLKDYKQKDYKFDKAKLERFISYFINIKFTTVDNTLNINTIDSLIKTNLLYTIKFEIKDYGIFKLYLITKPAINNSKEIDLNYIYGCVNGEKQFLNIKYYDIDPIIKDIDYFQ